VFSSCIPISSEDSIPPGSLEKYNSMMQPWFIKRTPLALGLGFRWVFLDCSLEIVQERLKGVRSGFHYDGSERSVPVHPSGRKVITVDNPQYYPDPTTITAGAEPYIRATIIAPERYMGAIMKLCMERRGVNSRFSYPAPGRMEILFDMPLAEVIVDFYDKLKTITEMLL
jgi:GTP-binding protein LepA